MTTSLAATARRLADHTPSTRNRYLDFLRVMALFVVVYGHFLMALVVVDGGTITVENALAGRPLVQWMTWLLQVMPLFFIVGGYVNAASWASAQARGEGYGTWVAARTRRLVGPAVAFVGVWSVVALLVSGSGLAPRYLALGGQVVAVPVWFLSVYLVVIALAPLSHRLHERYGGRVIGVAVLAALGIEVVATVHPVAAWANYVFVWGAIHQLGYGWRDGWFSRRRSGMTLALGGLVALLLLVAAGRYAVAMVGVDGANNQPPNLALFLLGVFQLGLALIAEPGMQRLLQRPRMWQAVIAANGLAMTVYLWHMTALVGFVALGLVIDNPLLEMQPMSASWWLTRPLWFAILTVLLAPLVILFRRFDAVGVEPHRVLWPTAVLAAGSASVAFGTLAARGFHPTTGFNVGATIAFGVAVVALRRRAADTPVAA